MPLNLDVVAIEERRAFRKALDEAAPPELELCAVGRRLTWGEGWGEGEGEGEGEGGGGEGGWR